MTRLFTLILEVALLPVHLFLGTDPVSRQVERWTARVERLRVLGY